MARGATDYTVGQPILMLETIFDDGSSGFKLFPTLRGFKMGLRALKSRIAQNAAHGFLQGNIPWAEADFRIHVCSPNWTIVKEADAEVLTQATEDEIESQVERIRSMYEVEA